MKPTINGAQVRKLGETPSCYAELSCGHVVIVDGGATIGAEHDCRACDAARALQGLLDAMPRCEVEGCNGVACWGWISHEPHYCNICAINVRGERGRRYASRTNFAAEVAAAEKALRGTP